MHKEVVDVIQVESSGRVSGTALLSTIDVCRISQINRGALRLYEREGLIDPPNRTPSGYRNYPIDTVERLEAIKQLKEIGLSLREIAALLADRDQGNIDSDNLRTLAEQQIQIVDARILRLHTVRGYLSAVATGEAFELEDPECNFLVRFLSRS
jgi:MerR family transcriptional regulator, copper efflux regulator